MTTYIIIYLVGAIAALIFSVRKTGFEYKTGGECLWLFTVTIMSWFGLFTVMILLGIFKLGDYLEKPFNTPQRFIKWIKGVGNGKG